MRRAFRDTAAHARGPVAGHRRFFHTDLALGARLGMLGGRQGRQINIQPEPVVSERVAEGQAFTAKERFTALPQLAHIGSREAVQRAGQGGLCRKLGPTPGMRQREIGAQAGVDLRDGPTARQDADQHIKQFGGWQVLHGLDRHSHRTQDRGQKAGPHQAVAEHTQGGKTSIIRHGDQSYRGVHHPPPPLG